jgi:hypothetical protein
MAYFLWPELERSVLFTERLEPKLVGHGERLIEELERVMRGRQPTRFHSAPMGAPWPPPTLTFSEP